MGINIDELREALGEKKPDEKIEIEREKLKLARERLDFEKEKHRDKERRAEAQNKPPERDGRAWVISQSITAFILLISLAFAVWKISRF